MNDFNPALATDLDWVRFLVGDWKDCPQVPSELIEAMLIDAADTYGAGKWNRYWVAAMVLEAMIVQWRASTKGTAEEEVSRLRIKYGGTGGLMDQMLTDKANAYRTHAAWLMHPKPKAFAILGTKPSCYRW